MTHICRLWGGGEGMHRNAVLELLIVVMARAIVLGVPGCVCVCVCSAPLDRI